ncbi:M48 family metallopeptidase [Bernardetia sp.]|uniref:M48 family metallopeptidase n=1 Tax=Bernardetia sp. TaxID=1937974 RepID=UPI0025BE0CBC|nr:M48 family metallopeptidase [Bernardetia sp.]
MKKIVLTYTVLLLGVLLNISTLYGQQDYFHQPLQSEGKIPPAFLNTAKENYAINSQNRTESELDDFNVLSGYAINQLLWSGKVIFGDTVTRYLNRVVDLILKDDPTLRQKIQIYTVKSPVVNAFTTSDGFIFVNLGLIASCENEAQLAYILSHEISHYVKQHSIKRYTFRKEEERNAKQFTWNNSKREKIDYTKRLNVSNYSKSQEIEADDYGLELFQKTQYSQTPAISGFEMLRRSDSLENTFAFEEEHFTNSYFTDIEDTLFNKSIKKAYKIGEVYESDDIEDEDDEEEFSTHPNIEERITNISSKINKASEENLYLVTTQEEFKNLQKIAQYEVLQTLLRYDRYVDAIHQISLLTKKYGKSPSLETAMAKATYGIAKYGNVQEKVIMDYDYFAIDWKNKDWYAALGRLDREDRTIFALTHLFSNLDKNLDTLYAKKAITDLLTDIHIYHEDLLSEDTTLNPNALEKIWVNEIKNHNSYPTFLKKAKEAYKEYKDWEDFKENDDNLFSYKRRVAKARYHGFTLGIDNIMMTDVRYIKLQTRKKKLAPLTKIIDKEEYAVESVEKISNKLNLNTTILDPKGLEKKEITLDIFNDLATINDWYAAQPETDEMYSFVPINHTQIEELADRNGTRHLVRMAMIDLKGVDPSSAVGFTELFLSIPTIYFLPYSTYRILHWRESIIITEIYDIDKARPLVIYNTQGTLLDKTTMKQNIFFQLSQIKSR